MISFPRLDAIRSNEHPRRSFDTECHLTPLTLTRTEFRLLAFMAASPNRVFDRAEMIDACLPEGEALERTVDTHMSNLRRKLSHAGAG